MIARTAKVILALLLLSAACGPMKATTAISSGRDAIEDARHRRAHVIPEGEFLITTAQYKYQLALLYMEKAKELQGFSKFQDAANYAEEARHLADDAAREMDIEAERKNRRKEIKAGKRLNTR